MNYPELPTSIKDWRVKVYNSKNKVIKTFTIKEKTELSALEVVRKEVDRLFEVDVADWTMTAI